MPCSAGGVAALMPVWLYHATDISGQLPTKRCAGALVTLLRHRSHPALSGLMVPGSELGDNAASNGGARTRAQTRSQGGLRYKQVRGVYDTSCRSLALDGVSDGA
jgi:hypothetical protein